VVDVSDPATTPGGPDRRWPDAELDPLARLGLVQATMPGSALAEAVIDAPFEDVWGYVSDLERSVPEFDRLVRRIRIRSRRPDVGDGAERLDVQAWEVGLPVPLRFDVRLEPGLCLMRGWGRLYFVGMAARPEGDRTRFRHVEGVPLPGARLLRPVFRRTTSDDMAGLIAALRVR
jgi:hypothetical protein